ncbi:MAG: hypothetical protein Kow0026_04580 [Oricola sp.]
MSGSARSLAIAGAGFLAGMMLSACTGERAGGPLVAEADASNAASLLALVNEKAQKCWIRSGDRAFRGLSVIPELDTRVGSPRLLVVERGKATGLPGMVIQADGNPVRITTYGPLTAAPVSARINDDVLAWSAGRDGC